MSHFVVLVVAKSESHIEALMEPYDENMEVEEYQRPCKCGEYLLRDRARAHAESIAGSIDSLRDAFHKDPEYKNWKGIEKEKRWKELIKKYIDAENEFLEAHKKENAPRADCDECHGSGTYPTTYNRESKWDWYQVGGRWAGSLVAKPGTPEERLVKGKISLLMEGNPYHDEKYPEKIRCDGLRVEDVDWEAMGTSEEELRKRWKEMMEDPPILQTIEALKEEYGDEDGYVNVEKDWVPYAVLSDDEGWKGRANMGWWGMDDSTPQSSRSYDEWFLKFRDDLIANHKDKMVFIVDCHI